MEEFKRQVEYTEQLPASMGLFMATTPEQLAALKQEALDENWGNLNNLTHSDGTKRAPTFCEETLAAYKTAATWMKADLTLIEYQAGQVAKTPVPVQAPKPWLALSTSAIAAKQRVRPAAPVQAPDQVWMTGAHDGGRTKRKSKKKSKRKSKKKRTTKKR